MASPATDHQHDVLRVMHERLATGSRPGARTDEHRLVLCIEGGGNRGVIPGGMAAALYDAGAMSAFDAVYGSSSGTLTAVWLLSDQIHTGLDAWVDPAGYARMSRPWYPLVRRPLMDLQWLIEEFYDGTLGLDADRVLANPITLHPLATDAATGATVDLASRVHDKQSLHTAMRASAALPMLTRAPVEIDGIRCLDAGLSESIPLDTPIADGATHLLVFGSRRSGDLTNDSRTTRMAVGRWMQRAAPGARSAYLGRNDRAGEVADRLVRLQQGTEADGCATTVRVLTVRPGPDSPAVGRGEGDAAVMRAGAAAGETAMRDVLGDLRTVPQT